VFLSGGNPRLLKNSFYIASFKEIMLEAILILNMDPRFREDDSGGHSHFHGNDRLRLFFVIPAFLIFVFPKQPAPECFYRVGIQVC
jgi:hypothetical protein